MANLSSNIRTEGEPSRKPSRYLHVSVDLLHGLRLMVTEEAHGRDGMSPPVRPIADNRRGGNGEVPHRRLEAAESGEELTRRCRHPAQPARGHLHSAPPPRSFPAPDSSHTQILIRILMCPVGSGYTRRRGSDQLYSHQVVDDVEAVILAVVAVDAAVGLLPHVVLQRCFVPEGFLTVQTLQTEWQPSVIIVIAVIECVNFT